MKIYETDQWSSTQVRKQKLSINDLKESNGAVYGGDADAARVIFGGGQVYEREVSPDALPRIGTVWFIPDVDGILQIYRTNYDSSD
jgi:hypothetical protein